jgi:hypothetical protein
MRRGPVTRRPARVAARGFRRVRERLVLSESILSLFKGLERLFRARRSAGAVRGASVRTPLSGRAIDRAHGERPRLVHAVLARRFRVTRNVKNNNDNT